MRSARSCVLPDFEREATETPGSLVTVDQVRRLFTRYRFAAELAVGRDVLEVACGPGMGLAYVAGRAHRVVAGDIDERNLVAARAHWRGRCDLIVRLDAQNLPLMDASIELIVMFEAIYFLPHPERFIAEAARVLRRDGLLLLSFVNRDLPDFVPGPHSHRYFSPPELDQLLEARGLRAEFFGEERVDYSSVGQLVFRLAKKGAHRLGLIPDSLAVKSVLKRLVFGHLVRMPDEVSDALGPAAPLEPVPRDRPDTMHRILYCLARKYTA